MKKIITSAILILILIIIGIIIFRILQPDTVLVEEAPIEEILKSENLGIQYVSPRVGFTIYPPADWIIDESGQLGTFAVFVPVNPGADDGLTNSHYLHHHCIDRNPSRWYSC